MPLTRTWRLTRDLLYVNLLSLLLIALIFLNQTGLLWLHALRVVLGLPFILFFPGYTLIAALFPGKKELDGLERTALSFGLSIAVVPLLGLGLNYTPWGIRLTPILIAIILFIGAMSAAAYYRRKKIAEEERFNPVFNFTWPRWTELNRLDKILSVTLVLAICFALASIFYVVTTPRTGEKFTEFYILGTSGKATGYPRDLAVGEKGQVIVGVVNHEYENVTYFVEIVMNGWVKEKTKPFVLTDGQKWEQKMSFSATSPHQNDKVQFWLFRQGDSNPYRTLHLWVDFAPVGKMAAGGK